MNKAHLARFVAVYKNRLDMMRETENRNHVRWMLFKLRELGHKGKLNRWIGFIQGFFWSEGEFSIDTMRQHIIDFSEPGEPVRCRHKAIMKGPSCELVHGSAETDICTECGAYRTLHHKVGRWQPGPVNVEEEFE